ncbi:hypothetical protein ACFY5J_28775 [Peribacillus butanolivorans]|uniref:hypothetical protein n=1 Tax=Peribacillus butanolivorans TaxID=421767 RepID=UPI00367867B1
MHLQFIPSDYRYACHLETSANIPVPPTTNTCPIFTSILSIENLSLYLRKVKSLLQLTSATLHYEGEPFEEQRVG